MDDYVCALPGPLVSLQKGFEFGSGTRPTTTPLGNPIATKTCTSEPYLYINCLRLIQYTNGE